MKVFLTSDFRCNIYNGELFLLPKAYNIYKRYADAFGELTLCSRFVPVNELSGGMSKADFIKKAINIDSFLKALTGGYKEIIANEVLECDLVIVRLPSIIAYEAAKCAKRQNKRYLAEIMCDGWAPYWNHGLSGKIIAPYMHTMMKSVTESANYAVYVTEKYLQERYPCSNPSIYASNVVIRELPLSVLANRFDHIDAMDRKNISIMTTADVNVVSKGHKFVVEAIKKLKCEGFNITYYLAGAGNQDILKKIARKNGVEENLVFLGRLTMEQIYDYLDKIDIYVHPSLQEGLPRAVIEAMSRACPCLGANTAGIPELLDSECIFEPASAVSIVNAVKRYVNQDLKIYAERNFEHCRLYLNDVLNFRRDSYFKSIVNDIVGETKTDNKF